jgi:hypothetical protein
MASFVNRQTTRLGIEMTVGDRSMGRNDATPGAGFRLNLAATQARVVRSVREVEIERPGSSFACSLHLSYRH